MALADSTAYLHTPGKEDISVDVVDGTSLPTISLGDAPTITSTDGSFTISASNGNTEAQSDAIEVNYRVTDSGTNKGFLMDSPINAEVTIPTSKSADITVTINREWCSRW